MIAYSTSQKIYVKKMHVGFDYWNDTKAKMPRLVFLRIKNAVLGEKYELSVAVVCARKMHDLNKRWGNKDKTTDILSFPLSKDEGEIYISPAMAKKEAKNFDRPYDNFILFLFIHGLVHLKGYEHSSRMESIEVKFRKKFGI